MKPKMWIVVRLFLFMSVVVLFGQSIVYAANEAQTDDEMTLYAKAAVLMDADTGRILVEKNGEQVLPMASTTKIMTCIVVLENTNQDDVVTVSKYAASQPKVHLGMTAGEKFTLKDLLYSLMLESHNDSAVALAEYVGSAALGKEITKETSSEESKEYVQAFINMMNQKARDIGCFSTYFVTPNGLDASVTTQSGETKNHQTTAADLARVFRYCINESVEKEQFLEITRTSTYSFADQTGKNQFSCANHNAFLQMMDGALSGKTGFTAKAGYCYVGALKRDGKTLIVALLACGWPNNKSYKWTDTKKLMTYGLKNYSFNELTSTVPSLSAVDVVDGQKKKVSVEMVSQPHQVLMNEEEKIYVQADLPAQIEAPVEQGAVLGSVNYYIGTQLVWSCPVCAKEAIQAKTFLWCVKGVGLKLIDMR